MNNGAVTQDEFELRFEDEDVLVQDIVLRWHRWRMSSDRSPAELKRIGLDLSERLIPDDIQKQILHKLSSCRARNTSLVLKVTGSVDFLSQVPWEVLEIACPESIPPSLRLAHQPDVAILRVATDVVETPIDDVSDLVRCLVVSANPGRSQDQKSEWSSMEMEQLRFLEAAGNGRITFQFLEGVTREALAAAMSEFKPDIFHFTGFADRLDSESCLLLHGSRPEDVVRLSATSLAECLIRSNCKVALLLTDETDGSPSSLASVLVRSGIPVVIGLQDQVRDASIPVFTRALYGAISDHVRLDRAVSEARLTIAGPQYGELLPTLWGQQASSLGSRIGETGVSRVTNLPTTDDECLGRDRELQELQEWVRKKSLVGITGMGGIGKSLLVRHLAHRLQTTVPQGVWFFDGTEIRDEATLWDELLEVCYPWNPHSAGHGESGPEAIVVVDHVDEWEPEELEQLVHRFEQNPSLHLVLIGRSIPGMSSDNRYEIGPLDSGELSSPAQVLFLKWAGLDGDELDRQDLQSTLSIGRLLEGVPLAIRIAAARAAIVGPSQMAALLEISPLQALGGPRSGVFDSIERSISTLEEDERRLLYQLSIFSGSFDWESLKAIYPDDPFEMLNGIERLCLTGLVRKRREHHSTRILLTPTVREYARQTTPDRLFFVINVARKRHLERFVELARRTARAFGTGRWSEGSRSLRLNHSDFRDALNFASEKQRLEKVADLCSYLCRPLLESGRYREFKAFLQEGYRAATELRRPDLEADLLGLEGAFAGRIGNRDRCIALWQRRAEICRETGHLAGLIDATLDLALETRNSEEALTLVDHADALLAEVKRPDLNATAGVIRAKIELSRGNIDSAIRVARTSGDILLIGEDRDSLPYVKTQLGHIWVQIGRYGDAMKAYTSAIEAAIDGERRSQAAIAALGLSHVLEHFKSLDKGLHAAEIARDLLVSLGSRRIPEAEERVAQLKPPNYRERAAISDPLESLRDFIETLPNEPLTHFAVVEVEAVPELRTP